MARWRRMLAVGSIAVVSCMPALAPPARADIGYVYDVRGRLVGVIDHSGEAAAYHYDAVGNLLAIDRLPAATPAILGFSPAEGPAGTAVTVDGVGFGAAVADNQAAVNGVAAPITAASPTRLVIAVPAGAATGPITVTAPGGTASSRAPFVVTDSRTPRITGFTPAMAPAGAPVTVSGEQFDPDGATTLTFNRRYAAVTSVAPTAIRAIVPEGAGSGRIGVGTPWGQAESDQDFIVLPPPLAAADVERSMRIANPGSAPVALATPGKVAIVLFDAVLGERLGIRLEEVTIGQSAVTVYGPDADVLASAPSVGPLGGALRFVVPRTGTCAVLIDPAGDATGGMTLRLGIADLVVADIAVPAGITTQQRVAVSWTARNDGTLDVLGASWFDLVYLTARGACCGGAVPAVSALRSTAPLPPGTSYTLSGTFTVPALPAGVYDLTVIVDPDDNAWDRQRASNQRSVEVTVTTPDLAATGLTAPASASTQETVQVSWTVKNRGAGSAAASGWNDALYLSPTPGCCEGATRLASVRRTTPTAAGATYTSSAPVTVPALAAGDHYIVLVTDADGELYESREGNNDRAALVRITTPDLTPTAFKTPTTVWATGSAWLSWTVKNIGGGPAVRAWSDRVYLSSSPSCCAGAKVLITVAPAPGLAPGATYTQIKKVTVPDLPAGAYYLFVRADAQNSLWEEDESNNQTGAPVTLRRFAP